MQDNFCVCWTSYSRGEAPHLNYLHSRCLRHTSNEPGRIRGSCTQTGRGRSMCRWESGWLKVRIILLNLCLWPNSIILNPNEAPDQRAIKERAQGKTNQRGTLTARRLIRIVQTVGVSIAFEAFSDAVSTATLEVTGMTSPQLCNNSQTQDEARCHIEVYSTHGKRELCHDYSKETFIKLNKRLS